MLSLLKPLYNISYNHEQVTLPWYLLFLSFYPFTAVTMQISLLWNKEKVLSS